MLKMNEIYKYNDNHRIFFDNIFNIVNYRFTNWNFNRPVDQNRVTAISNFIIDRYRFNKNYIFDFEIKLVLFNGMYFIIDGMHRYSALCDIMQKIVSNSPIIDGCHELQYKTILLNIERNLTIDEIYDRFITINKAVPVPLVYINNQNIREIVLRIVKHFYELYPSLFKTSRNPQKPHTNRDTFTDRVTRFIHDNHLQNNTAEQIIDIIMNYNISIRNNLPTCTQRQLEKCNSTGCYLFLDNYWAS